MREETWSPAFGSLTDAYLRVLLEERLANKHLCWFEVVERVVELCEREPGAHRVPTRGQVENWFRRQTTRARHRR